MTFQEQKPQRPALRTMPLAIALAGTLLGGCVKAPLSPEAKTGLYRWDNARTPITSRPGISQPDEMPGLALFNFTDSLAAVDELDLDENSVLLLKSCEAELCYKAAVFPGDYMIDANGRVLGLVILSGLSTAMVNEVSDLPMAEVRDRLEQMADLVLGANSRNGDYTAFLAMDILPGGVHRQLLANVALEEQAQEALLAGTQPSFNRLVNGNATRTEELVASEDFLFNSTWQLEVDVDVSARLDGDSYLMICGDYSPQGTGYAVSYDNCQLKTPLIAGRYQGTLTLTGTEESLLVTIMPLATPESLEQTIWQRQAYAPTLSVR